MNGSPSSANGPEVRVATFNVENLLARFDFDNRRRDVDRVLRLYGIEDEDEYRDAERARRISLTDDMRQHSALALAEAEADIVCLQEVENLETLDAFEYGYLYRMMGLGYRQKVWREGNDKRGIDVAVIARERTRAGEPIEVLDVRNHKKLNYGDAGLFEHLPRRIEHPNERVFRRDLLAVDLRVGTARLTVYVTHLKAMGGSREDDEGERVDGREWTMPIRLAEVRAMRSIIEANHEPAHNWIIGADLNDYAERVVVRGPREGETFEPIDDPSAAISALLDDGFAYNPVSKLSPLQRWTLYHAAGPERRHLCQLDYLLLSPALHRANADALPAIVRAGQPWRTPLPPGCETARFPRIGWDRPKASDHCPVAMTLRLT